MENRKTRNGRSPGKRLWNLFRWRLLHPSEDYWKEDWSPWTKNPLLAWRRIFRPGLKVLKSIMDTWQSLNLEKSMSVEVQPSGQRIWTIGLVVSQFNSVKLNIMKVKNSWATFQMVLSTRKVVLLVLSIKSKQMNWTIVACSKSRVNEDLDLSKSTANGILSMRETFSFSITKTGWFNGMVKKQIDLKNSKLVNHFKSSKREMESKQRSLLNKEEPIR